MSKTVDFFFQELGSLSLSPAISGATSSIPGLVQTYTINARPGASYCWEAVRGNIVRENGNSVNVQWTTANRAGVLTVTETIGGQTNKSSSIIVDVNNNAMRQEALALNGQQREGMGALDWEVPAGTTVGYYIIERQGPDGAFEAIGKVEANDAGGKQFVFADYNPLVGANAYRLNEVDASGEELRMAILEIGYTGNNSFVLSKAWPNPMVNELTVDFATKETTKLLVKVVDVKGVEVLRQEVDALVGQNRTVVNTATLTKGVYVLVLDNGFGQLERIKLIK